MEKLFPRYSYQTDDAHFAYFSIDDFLEYCKLAVFVTDDEIEKASLVYRTYFSNVKGNYHDSVTLSLFVSQHKNDRLTIQQFSTSLDIPIARLLVLFKDVRGRVMEDHGSAAQIKQLVD